MGWITKKNRFWEMKQVSWQILSLLAIVPIPIHIYPFGLIRQGNNAKVKSWVGLGIFMLLVELAIFVFFLANTGSMNMMLIGAAIASFVSYIIGNFILINNAKFYIKRMELATYTELKWIKSKKNPELWEPNETNSPQVFLANLLSFRKQINNNAIRGNIDKIVHHFQLLAERDTQKAELFMVRHQTVLNVLEQYRSLEVANINNSVTNTSKQELAMVLDQASVAIENEITNQFRIELIEVNADSTAYLNNLKNRNLLK